MKKYKFEVVLEESYDEFFEQFTDRTGCDEVVELVKNLFADACLEAEITLKEFTQ